MRLLLTLALGLGLGLAWAQTPQGGAAPLRFDAATVAVSPPGAQFEGGSLYGGRAVYINATLHLRRPSDPDHNPSVDITMAESLAKLGLKLVPTTMPATVVVVDSASATPLPSAHPLPPMPPPPTAFEFAVIKPQGAMKPYGFRITPGGEVNSCCMALGFFIGYAFNIDLKTIANPPKWLNSPSPADHWDLEAKTVPGTAFGDVLVMLQNMLKTRFGFVYHEETRRVPVYALRAGSHPRLKPTQGGRSNCQGLVVALNANITCTNTTMAQFATY